MIRYLLLFTTLMLSSASMILAQSMSRDFFDDANPLTADEAVRIAISKNGELQALRLEAEASEKLVIQAGQRGQISVEASGQQRTFGTSNSYMFNTNIPLELAGRRNARMQTAARKAEIKSLLVREREYSLAESVRKKYGETVAQALKYELTKQFADSLEETLRIVGERVREGRTAPLEENILVVELNRVRVSLEKQLSSAETSLYELKNICGLEPLDPFLLSRKFPEIRKLPDSALLESGAFKNRTQLQLFQAAMDLADANRVLAEAESKPDLMAMVGYQRMSFNEQMRFSSVLFGVKLILPRRNKDRELIEASLLDGAAARARLDFGLKTVKQEVASAVSRYTHAVRSQSIFENGIINEAERNLDVVREMYDLGSISVLEYLSEQRNYIELSREMVDSKLETYLAGVELDAAVASDDLVTR
ncbi:MAG: TolC family protein [Pyrinomonadaceae bacterium]